MVLVRQIGPSTRANRGSRGANMFHQTKGGDGQSTMGVEAAIQCRFLSDADSPRSPQLMQSSAAMLRSSCGGRAGLRQKRVFTAKYYLRESSLRTSTRHSLARVGVPWHTFRRDNFGWFFAVLKLPLKGAE